MIFMLIYSSRYRTSSATTKLTSNGEEWKNADFFLFNVSRCGKIGNDAVYVKEDCDKKIISFSSKRILNYFWHNFPFDV